jgi:hypothetical protein
MLNESILSVTDNLFKNTILVYPNPTNSIIHISTIETSTQVFLYNAIGQMIISKNSNTMDISTLDKGVYFLKVELKNKEHETIKIIKN